MKYYSTFVLCLTITILSAQINPVKWTFDLHAAGDGKAEFVAKAEISKGWNIYSVYMEDGGPVATSFTFEDVHNGALEGKIIEKSEKISAFDDLFEMKVVKFKQSAEFTQAIKKLENGLLLKGNVLFMCCDSHRCLPPARVPFELKL